MKKLFLIAVLMPFMFSCDFILKDTEEEDSENKTEKKVVLGNDKDVNGCVTSAGYKWSLLKNECVRVFEEGYRLNPIEELKVDGVSNSAFVIFEDNGNRAELFLPGSTKSLMLKKESDKSPYTGSEWSLQSDKGYTLSKNGVAQYAGAAIEEKKITGDTEEE